MKKSMFFSFVIFIVFLLPPPSIGVGVIEDITNINKPNPSPLIEAACEGIVTTGVRYSSRLFNNPTPTLKSFLKCPLEFKNFCKVTRYACATRYRVRDCFFLDRKQQASRERNLKLKRNLERFTIKKFFKYTTDPELQKTCCGTDEVCKEHFSQTKLTLLGGTNTLEAYYKPVENRVCIAKKRIISSADVALIEGVILHELGHACQYALARSQGRYKDLALECSDSREKGNVGFSRLPFGIGSCLNRRLEEAVRTGRGVTPDYCFNRMREEAFANTVFASKQRRTLHWGSQCNMMVSKYHPAFSVYFPCIAKNPEFSKNFCQTN